MIPVDKNNPATWRFLAGQGSDYFTPEESAQHVIDLGANGSYSAPFIDFYGATSPIQRNGLTQTQQVVRFAQEIHRLSGLFHMQIVPWTWYSIGFTQAQRDCIYNINGAGDTYIQWVKNWIPSIQPDICQIMNEIIGDATDGSGTASDEYWLNYIAFCNRYMAEMNAIKPNMTFSISSIPFWWLGTIADKVFNVPSGCKLIYDYHYYYSFDGVRPDVAHIGYDIPEQLAYWDGNFALGKQLTYASWDNPLVGVSALVNQGKTVFFDEQGTNINSPNFGVWMKDAIDYCVQHGIGFSYLDNTGLDENGSYNFSPASFWSNQDWTLNAIGQRWKELVVGATPTPVQLPFHDSFTNPALPNWNKINGTWSAT